jgi:hypothetical protein
MKEISLTKGKLALVDDEDFEYLNQWKWYCSPFGYALRSQSRRLPGPRIAIKMHRVVCNTPEDMETDHINGNKLDNRRSNLRACTRSENQHNRNKLVGNTSGFKGVTWHIKSKKWASYIVVNNHQIYLGLFQDIIDAANAYDSSAKKYFGEFARLNFPERVTI